MCDESRLIVTLVEAGPRILPALPDKLARAAKHELEALGVKVREGVRVVRAEPRCLVTAEGERITGDLLVWAAGVKAPDFLGGVDLETNRNNQLVVTETLQTTDDPRIYAMGDCCACAIPGQERPVPPRAQAARQMASVVYANLLRQISGKELKPFVYKDHGSLVSLCRFSTVGSLMGNLVGGQMAVEGRLARFVDISLYRMHQIGIHVWAKGIALLLIGRVNRIVRPQLKLH